MKHFYIIFIMIILFSCSTTPMPKHTSGSETVVIPQDFFGMVHAGMSAKDEEYELLDEMNVVWLLYTFHWEDIEKEKGVYDFNKFDKFVESAKKHNKKIIAVLAYCTRQIIDETKKIRYVPPKYIPDYLNYVEALVNHFGDKIDAWQIWNEPNGLFWKGTDKEYYELAKQAVKRIRDVNPNAFIIGGGFARTPKNFIRKMKKAGALENLDAISFHPYDLNPAGAMILHDNFNKLMKEINFDKEIWITEVGYPTGGWYPTKVSLDNFSSYIIKTISGAAARGPRTLLWYQFTDRHLLGEAPNNHDSEQFFGLTYKDYSRKKGSWAYELCARFLPGSSYVPELPLRENVPSNIVSFCFMGGSSGRNTLILWNDRRNKQKIRVTLSSHFILHSISSDSNNILEDNSIIDVTNTPVFITWEGESTPIITKVNK